MVQHDIKIPPVSEPVSLAEMRLYLGITQVSDTTRDGVITDKIKAAREMVESYTGKALLAQTRVAYDNAFPTTRNRVIALNKPLQSVTRITYVDTNGIEQTLDPALYHVNAVAAYIAPAYGKNWPAARDQANSVQIEYVCGYADASAVPERLKEAIRFIVGQWEVFQTTIEGVVRPMTIPYAATQLIDTERDYRGYY